MQSEPEKQRPVVQVSLDPNFSGGKDDVGIKSNIFLLAADVIFQVDLFGRYRRATEAAR